VLGGLMMTGIWVGLAYMFVGITARSSCA